LRRPALTIVATESPESLGFTFDSFVTKSTRTTNEWDNPKDRKMRSQSLQMRHVWSSGFTQHRAIVVLLTGTAVLFVSGCTTVHDYVENGYKVGPNYSPRGAYVSDHWIDFQDPGVQSDSRADDNWWTVFNDPVLNQLIAASRNQNLSLRVAVWRIEEARAERCIAIGELFPQKQQAVGNYTRYEESKNFRTIPNQTSRFFSEWNYGGLLAWELDFWGLYRRAVESADATLDARVEDYRNVLVLLQAEVGQEYCQIRAADQELAYVKRNLEIEKGTLKLVSQRFHEGATTEVDELQATSHVAETEALIPPLQIIRRQAMDRLCHLIGIPPRDIDSLLRGSRPIPTAPPKVAVGIPAALLSERPDVRAAEREVAAQSAEVGVATAKLYPHISITGFIGYRAETFPQLFEASSGAGNIGPTIQWDVLNYGRLVNGIRVQDARLQERAYHYQDVVLQANQEVEDGLIAFLKSQVQVKSLIKSTTALSRASELVLEQYREGLTSFNVVYTIQRRLVQQQTALARAQAAIPEGLIQVFKALGGGWKTPIDATPIEDPSLVAPPALQIAASSSDADAASPGKVRLVSQAFKGFATDSTEPATVVGPEPSSAVPITLSPPSDQPYADWTANLVSVSKFFKEVCTDSVEPAADGESQVTSAAPITPVLPEVLNSAEPTAPPVPQSADPVAPPPAPPADGPGVKLASAVESKPTVVVPIKTAAGQSLQSIGPPAPRAPSPTSVGPSTGRATTVNPQPTPANPITPISPESLLSIELSVPSWLSPTSVGRVAVE
jgi:NodT family efflux transporter outer membrane factor (OMF) lipoprotein